MAGGVSLASAGNVVAKRRLVLGNKICVPMAITPYVIREHHESLGHVRQEKLLLELPRHYNMAIEGKVLRDLVHRLVSTCVLCQAYKQPARDPAVNARPMPVPSSVGDHVALDEYQIPHVHFRGRRSRNAEENGGAE